METVCTGKRTGIYWLGLSLAVIILDQITKNLIATHFTYNEAFYLLPFLNLTLEFNKGAAFSFLSEVGNIAKWLFMSTAFLISLILCVWLYRLPPRTYWLAISLSLILGGAIGNLFDRIAYGYVIDFIHFHVGSWSWPIFNVADIAITIGAAMLLIDVFRKKEPR